MVEINEEDNRNVAVILEEETSEGVACSAGVLLGRVSVTTLRPPF